MNGWKMVPKVAQQGRSFKGAAAYYLHDKKADTDERVAFTETVNLPTNDPRRAVAHMIDTATHANELKAASGIKATGNKLKNPVYSYSVAWHPTEAPTMAEQINAARETLKVLGLADRQALIVGHNDTAHPHVHVIVNRVCPETGMAAKHGNDFNALSRWAQDYEQRTGKVLCLDRVENNAARDRGERPRYKYANAQRQKDADRALAKMDLIWDEYRKERDAAKEQRKPEWDALFKERKARIQQRKKEVKAHHSPAQKAEWRALFKKQKNALGRFDSFYLARLKFALTSNSGRPLKAQVEAIFSANTRLRRDFLRKQETARRVLSKQHRTVTFDAVKEVQKAWERDRDALRKATATESKERVEKYRAATSRVWRGQTDESVRKPAAPKPQPAPSVWDAHKPESVWNKHKPESVWNKHKATSVWNAGKKQPGPEDPGGRKQGRTRSRGRRLTPPR